ncbi:MerR family transcriptional regulator [Mangrovimonas sp. DI 80]|uniref:MerR family transcriptional regulator n=1 Tax=Mangrovimonas sp. DI 80 TaxID=1779330 RepID=UPI0009765A7E|nr:MerR family transcriptional regulator [Mangrovimonas sp. DI 80]OMP31016.1 MerR family transcriptional regulator [Mangrovimonas sp. DI 80]
MGSYSMAQVVSITGIKSHTLRKWESRYSFLTPMRTETNIRYYTEEQLKALLNIGILTRNGYRISQIDKMSPEAIYEAVSQTMTSGSKEDEINALIVAMINFDEAEFDKIFKSEIVKAGLVSTITHLIYPFLRQVGVLWGSNKVMPAQEHFISNLIRRKIFHSVELLAPCNKNAPKMVLFLSEGECHEIALLLAYYITRSSGWNVFYLGQSVPYENLEKVVNAVEPDLLMTIYTSNDLERTEGSIQTILEMTDIPLVVSGGPVIKVNQVEALGQNASYLKGPGDLVQFLQNFQVEA